MHALGTNSDQNIVQLVWISVDYLRPRSSACLRMRIKKELKKETAPRYSHGAVIYVGDDLLSHTLSRAVQSALRGLTSVFGMGTGVSPAVRSPASQARASLHLGRRRGLHARPIAPNL